MSRSLALPNLTKLIILVFVGLALSFWATKIVFSQDASPSATPAAEFAFPIADLGGCTDLASCTNFCEDPVNQNACTTFAKENGFYQDDITTYGDDEFWTETQSELGCNSADSCFTYCSDPLNHDSCDSFANRNEIPGGYTATPDNPEYLTIAQTTLGCDSAATCATHCDDPANAQACSDFASDVGILGGTHSEGPGGCQTPETCGAYCSDPNNFSQCSSFAPGGGTFAGPGGCTDEASCRSYCEQNPESCRSYAAGSNGAYVPIICAAGEYHGPGGACTATADTQQAVACAGADQYWDGTTCQAQPPVGISTETDSAHFEARADMGNCATPGTCFDYCQANPTSPSCVGFDPSGGRPSDDYTPYLYYTPGSEVTHAPVAEMGGCTSPAGCYDYCRANPGSCDGFSANSPRPPEVYIPGTYYTPPANTVYVTPPATGFYTTPIYYTPPEGSNYTTPQYYTPGMYSTPSYQTPPTGSNYTTPNYYTPWSHYPTPTGEYPTPTYASPTYYTPPRGSDYTTPYYYTPPTYTTPYYLTPVGDAVRYTTPTYTTPPPYTTPQYYTPHVYGVRDYSTPVYYTPITYNTPYYPTPPIGSPYTTPQYYTPPAPYTTPQYYTPGKYPTPPEYTTPPPYTTPVCNFPGCSYYTPAPYNTPPQYPTPPQYTSPYFSPGGPYTTPNYYTPPIGSPYTTPSYPAPYSYPSPGSPYGYPTPSTGPYPYPYPTPGGSDQSPVYGYPTPGSGYSYPTPNTYYYPSPPTSYGTPPSYASPPYGTPDSYSSPSYASPPYGTPSGSYPTPEVHGASTCKNTFLGLCLPW